jgi:predicted metal-dependent peptidase
MLIFYIIELTGLVAHAILHIILNFLNTKNKV